MKRISAFLALGIIVCSTPDTALSQDSAGVFVLVMGPGIRSYGMGETGVADGHDPANIYYNPAVIYSIKGVFFTGGYGKLVPELASDMYFLNAGAGVGFGLFSGEAIKVRAGGGIRSCYLSYGEWGARDSTDNYLGVFSSSEKCVSFSLGGGASFRDLFFCGAGLSLKPYWIDLAPAEATIEKQSGSASGVALDLGMLMGAVLDLPGGAKITPSIGVSMLNLGSDVEFINAEQAASLPRNYRLGLTMRIETPSLKSIDDALGARTPIGTLSLNHDVVHDRFNRRNMFYDWGTGAELGLLQMLFLRCGYVHDESGNIKDFTFGTGLGFQYQGLWGRIDYASVPQARDLGRTNKFGISGGLIF